jgi:hypothetical protein
MDEMWQRHKTFILQTTVMGVVFLVAFLVMRSLYGDYNDPERTRAKNEKTMKELREKRDAGRAPSELSIKEQRDIAQRAETTKRDLLKRVASVAGRDEKTVEADREKAYVRESIERTAANIGRQSEVGAFEQLFATVPQACLSRLRDASRASLISRAAQAGKEIDETLGMSGGYAEDEIPAALHGLSIVTDVVGRFLAKERVDKVQAIRIAPRSQFPELNGVGFVSAIGVHLEVIGDPIEIGDVIRSFNSVGKPEVRMNVLESIEYVVPMSADDDEVKASINIVGLRLKAEMQAEGK